MCVKYVIDARPPPPPPQSRLVPCTLYLVPCTSSLSTLAKKVEKRLQKVSKDRKASEHEKSALTKLLKALEDGTFVVSSRPLFFGSSSISLSCRSHPVQLTRRAWA